MAARLAANLINTQSVHDKLLSNPHYVYANDAFVVGLLLAGAETRDLALFYKGEFTSSGDARKRRPARGFG